MNFLRQLIEFGLTPIGLVLLVVGGAWAFTIQPNRPPWPWVLLGLCGFMASLNEYRGEFIEVAPPLVYPFQQIRAAGRPLTGVLLLLLLFLALRTDSGWRQRIFPRPLLYLSIIQAMIALKVLQGGSLLFAVLSAITFGSIVVMLVRGPSRWLQEHHHFDWGMGAIALTGAFFLGASLYQARFDTYPLAFIQDLYMGTTGNPQHAAVLLMLTLPAWLYLLMRPQQPLWHRPIWATALGITGYALVQTGSRTGVLATLVGLVVFFVQRLRTWQVVVLLVLSLMAVVWFSDNAQLPPALLEALPGKLTQVNNTREGVWEGQWTNFIENPFLGAPLRGDRQGFGENSWLAVAAALGIVGLVPLSLFAYYCGTLMVRLYAIGRDPRYTLQCKAVIAGLASLLVGSIAEAYLLTLISFPIFALGTYLVLGQYLLECADRDRAWEEEDDYSLMPLAEPDLW